MTQEDKITLEDIDFGRKLGIIHWNNDDNNHLSIEVRHNFMCHYCHHYLDKEEGFVIIPMSRLKELRKKDDTKR